MATYYIDPTWSGAQNGTESEPYSTYAAAFAAHGLGGDIFLQRSGTIATEQVTIPASNITLGIYGGSARATIDGELVRAYCLEIVDVGGFSLTGIDLANGLINCGLLRITANHADIVGFTFRDMDAYGCRQAAGSGEAEGTGFLIISADTSSSTTNGSIDEVDFHNCVFRNNSYHGFDILGRVKRVTIHSGCIAHTNSQHRAAQGFTTHGRVGTWTSGWELVSGAVYRHSMANANDAVQRVHDRTTNTLLKFVDDGGTAGAAGTLRLFEWDYSSTYVYINTGNDLAASADVYISRCPITGPITFDGAESYNNLSIGGLEGMGFCADDVSENVWFKRCLSYSNGGEGFRSNKGRNVYFIACRSVNDGGDSYSISTGSENVHAFQCGSVGSGNDGYAVFSNEAVSVQNSYAKNAARYGFNKNNASSQAIFRGDLVHGSGTADTNNVSSGVTVTDPDVNLTNGLPNNFTATSPCAKAGVFLRPGAYVADNATGGEVDEFVSSGAWALGLGWSIANGEMTANESVGAYVNFAQYVNPYPPVSRVFFSFFVSSVVGTVFGQFQVGAKSLSLGQLSAGTWYNGELMTVNTTNIQSKMSISAGESISIDKLRVASSNDKIPAVHDINGIRFTSNHVGPWNFGR